MMDRDGSKMIGGWLGKLADGESIHLGRKLKMRKRYGKKRKKGKGQEKRYIFEV